MPRPARIDWKKTAAALAVRIPRAALHGRVVAWADGGSAAARGGWAVGFSGGADSLALLLLLWAHWPARRSRLTALHFNHRLRGRASSGDAQFCERVCRALDVRFVEGTWADAPRSGGVSEAMARTARFDFFQRELTRRRIRALWLGHQRDDIAETMLMRLARGSGAAGLCAPRPLQEMPGGRVHARPLLSVGKEALILALGEAGAVWREDASNAADVFTRNRMRSEVMPVWQAAAGGRDAVAGAALSRELLEEDDVALEAWVDALAPVSKDGQGLNTHVLQGKPRAVVRRALHRWLVRQADTGDLSRQGFEALLAAVERGRFTRFSLGRGGLAVLRQGVLRLEAARTR